MSFLNGFESKKAGIDDTVEWILRVTVVTLSAIMMAVIATLMFGLFNNDVDNAEIFSIIGPAFNTIVGAFVGLLGGLSLNANVRDKKPEETLELVPEMEVGEFNSVPLIRPVDPAPVVEDDDDDMEPWEKYRNDLRYDANGDGVVDEEDFPDWRNPAT
jgi:hypothetical protein